MSKFSRRQLITGGSRGNCGRVRARRGCIALHGVLDSFRPMAVASTAPARRSPMRPNAY